MKLDNYYRTLEETPIWYAGLALHPAYRWNWFDRQWNDRPERTAKAKDIVTRLWNDDYRHLRIGEDAISGDEPQLKRQRTLSNPFEAFCEQTRNQPRKPQEPLLHPAVDEYQHWIDHPERSDDAVRDPLLYWHEKRLTYPRLSLMALDLLTVQPMSAECERLFSAAGPMVTPLRNALEADIVGMCQVLRSWLRAGVIKQLDPLFYSVYEENDEETIMRMTEEELAQWARSWLTTMDSVNDD